MASEFEENMKAEPSSGSNNNDAGDFECNICFELAQDPIVTLCGHLYCWPCLYRWLHHHSQSQECPVCKALIEENKLVPLYGRGKSNTDPRTRPIPGDDIPNRPSGQRPDTAPPPPPPGPADQNYFSNLGFGFLSGFMPMATARFGSITMSAGFGGMLPWSMMSAQFNGFPHNPPIYGAAHGFPYGYPQPAVHGNRVHHGHGFGPAHNFHHHHGGFANHGQDSLVKLLLIIGFLVFAALALCDFS